MVIRKWGGYCRSTNIQTTFLFKKLWKKLEIQVMTDFLEVYTDGAYSSLRDQGGIGIVVVKNNIIIQTYQKNYKHTTNNQMELIAIISVLYSIKKPIKQIVLYTDSMYVIGCATKGWKRKKNQNLWKKYDEVYKNASEYCSFIEFKHVKGHENNQYNNLADKLAVEASHLD